MTDLAGKIATPLCAAGTLALAIAAAAPWLNEDGAGAFYLLTIGVFSLQATWVVTTALVVCAVLGVAAVGRLAMGEGRKAAAIFAGAGGVGLFLVCTVLGDDWFPVFAGPGQFIAVAALLLTVAAGLLAATREATSVTALGAAALLWSLTLPWYGTSEYAYFNRSVGQPAVAGLSDSSDNAWVSFVALDLVLTAVAVLGAVAAWIAFRGRPDPLRLGAATVAASGVCAVLVLWRIADPPNANAEVAPAVALALTALACLAGGSLLSRTRARTH